MKLIKFTFVFFVNENPKAAVSDQSGSFGLNLALALVEDGMPVKFWDVNSGQFYPPNS